MKELQLSINNQTIKYKFRRSKKAKRIILQIKNNGELELVIPYGIREERGLEFLRSKTDWLAKYAVKLKRQEPEYKFFGSEINIIKKNFKSRYSYIFDDFNNTLFIKPDVKDEEQLYLRWLKFEAQNYIAERVKYFSSEFNFNPKKLSFRNQKTRWGSCNSKGHLSFNIRLMMYEPEVIDYVIVHELCHLREMNHSPKFWKEVEKILPDHKKYRKVLKSGV